MNKKQKEILRIFIVIYLISFTVINWNDVSWILNYRVISGLFHDFFNPYPSIAYYSNSKSFEIYTASESSSYDDFTVSYIEIPSIGIAAPIVFPQSEKINSLTKDLDRGVVYYPGSVLPGQEGQIVVLGHSAPPNWPKIKYDWVFILEVFWLIFILLILGLSLCTIIY